MANTQIGFSPLSIQSCFNDHYIVPDYQREYVWTEDEVEQLLSDLADAFSADNKKDYFLGTIVTYKSDNVYELIDGQQRLTTFFILLCALKKRYEENAEDATVISNLLYSPTMNEEGNTVNLLHLRLQYLEAGDCLEQIERGNSQPLNVSNSGVRLFNAFGAIESFFNDKYHDRKELKRFAFFLLQKTNFIRIETHDITDALKIFETINQRGKGLDPMDLLKNIVFRQVDRELFKELNLKWKRITEALEKVDEKPLRFLRYFIMANYDTSSLKDGILREDRIYNWICENNAQCHYVEDPFGFVKKMSQNVERYVLYRNARGSDNGDVHLKNITSLAGRSYKLHLMLMLSASVMEDDASICFKRVVESVVYYTVINRITTNVTERTFASWCNSIRGIKTIGDLYGFIESIVIPTLTQWKQDNESNFLRLSLNSMQQYRVKFILAKITAYVDALRLGKKDAGGLSDYTDYAVEIEHIMPQTCIDKSIYGLTEEEFLPYLNRLGNLTLLENSINKSIKNEAYVMKLISYKHSKFYLTSAIPELVNQGANTAINRTNDLLMAWTVWNKQSVEERQKMLYRLSEMIWDFTNCKR